MEEQQEYIEHEVQKHYVFRQILRYCTRIIAWVALVLLFLIVLVQIPAIQNWLVNRVTNSIEQKVETPVRFDHIYLSFFDHLVLKQVYIEDHNCDTLLYVGKLDIDINLNPFVLFKKGLVIEKMGLTDALVNIHKIEGSPNSNVELFLEKLFDSDEVQETVPQKTTPQDTVKGSFSLGLDKMFLRNVNFRKNDEVRGNNLDIFLAGGDVLFNNLDLPNKLIDVQATELTGLAFKTESFPSKPLPFIPNDNYIDNGGAEVTVENSDSTLLKILIRHINLDNSSFSLHNYYKAPVKTTQDSELDFKHLEVFDIGIQIDSFEFQDLNFKGIVNCISGQTSTGFQLDELSVKEAAVTPTRATLNGLRILTPDSEVGDTLVFRYKQYSDFKDFVDEVRISSKINESSVALKDIMVFAPKLEQNQFFRNNRETVLKMEGIVSGKINTLRVRKLDINLPDGSKLAGNFGSRNITVKSQEIINLQLTEMRTTMRTLRQLLPNFKPPETFDRLGHLFFTGRFDGFFADFVAFGDLRTDIGRAKMDMQMNLL